MHPDDKYIDIAIEQAKKSLSEGGIPIGAALIHEGKVIGVGHNMRIQNGSPIFHGETSALHNAGRQKADVYRNSVLVTTLSPCAMCTGTILLYRIPKVIIGENVNHFGEEELLRSRGVDVRVLQNEECIDLMKSFISARPELWFEDIGAMYHKEITKPSIA